MPKNTRKKDRAKVFLVGLEQPFGLLTEPKIQI